jgi:hypothetical protein
MDDRRPSLTGKPRSGAVIGRVEIAAVVAVVEAGVEVETVVVGLI